MKFPRCLAAVSLLVLLGVAAPYRLLAQDNLRDAAPFNGYTGVPFDTTNEHYDYLVDSSLSADDPAAKKFRTVQAAYAAAPAGTPDHPTVIGIKPDVYLMHVGPDAPSSLEVTKSYITFLGLTDDRRKVVLADNRGNKEGANNNGYILDINATGFTLENLAVVNYANLDYEYPGDHSKDLHMRSPVITQAVAVNCRGDKHVYSHVAILSRLDTMFIQTTRSYFTNVFIEGTDDFLGGGQVSVFNDSEIYFPTGNGVMSASGITFLHTVFKAAKGLEFYKGFRNPDTLIDCVMPYNTAKSPLAWMVWKGAVRQNVFSLTYRLKDPSGHPVRLKDSLVGMHTYTLSRELTPEEVKAFNPWNLLRATPNGPADDWDPAHARDKYAADGSDVFRMALTGPTAPEAIPGAGPFISSAVSPSIRTGGAGATINASVSPARARDAQVTWSSPSKLISLSAASGDSVTVTGNNPTDKAQWIPVRATAPNGFYVQAFVYVEPKYIEPPTFAKQLTIAAPLAGKVSVQYALNFAGHPGLIDQSLITWSQCDDAQCSNARKVAVSRGDLPLKTYTLTPGSIGKYLKVSIRPKHNISDPGPEVTAISTNPITRAEVTSPNINPNFRNFVEASNPAIANGEWTVIGTWTSVTGDNLVNGYGLRVSNPPNMNAGPGAGGIGATAPARAPNPHSSLVYDNDGPVGDMSVKVVMTPEKTAGQGFGIAGSPDDDDPRSQRADIYIKYDPRTRTGYSLRYWRTIQSAEKVMFQLYRIENGVGTPLNDRQQLTGVFKPNCTITLSVVGGKLTAKGSNMVDGETLSLEGDITPNPFGGAGVYWSGSVPVGNSNVYSEIRITYPPGAKH
jgi:hypothetical protein